METKKCKKCNITKDIDNFTKNNRNNDKLDSNCKECLKKKYNQNKEKNLESQKIWRENNKDYSKKWRENNEERLKYEKRYYLENADKYIKRKQKWRKENPILEALSRQKYILKNRDKINKYHREWKANKRKIDIEYKLNENMSRRIRSELNTLLNTGRKNKSTKEYVGCSIEYLKIYLESKFDIGMSWNNYGISWQIDHIIPCKAWKLLNHVDNYYCWNYKNLQPMWAFKNKSKKDKYENNKKIYYTVFMTTIF
jgi:hypothetical protein